MRQVMSKQLNDRAFALDPEDRSVLEFDLGLRVYPPKRDGG